MSRIFTFEEIEQKQVPTVDDFGHVLNALREQLPTLPNFIGAVIFGSALSGNFRRTSDIDVFVAFDDPGLRLSQETKQALNQLTSLARDHYVPIDWLPNTREQLQQGLHTIRAGGLDHISWGAAHGGLIGTNPVVYHPVNRRAEAIAYTLFAMDELVRADVRWPQMTEIERNKVRGKALDRPVAAARRVLELKERDVCALPSGEVVAAMKDKKLRRLWRLSEWYRRRLELQLTYADRQHYLAVMETLDTYALPQAHDFLAELLSTTLA